MQKTNFTKADMVVKDSRPEIGGTMAGIDVSQYSGKCSLHI